ncbi:CCHC-type integrase [Gossypium australe]|uniref:CCHC-type integrase n=1 Tax=Gossypium australe TaxID=47621 RepID=A0A5B6VA48_9ROSI|nr:CCHC-type integrase [Gossypium australe]
MFLYTQKDEVTGFTRFTASWVRQSVWQTRVFEQSSKNKIELLKDYDCMIEYHPDKANVVADALIRKSMSEL